MKKIMLTALLAAMMMVTACSYGKNPYYVNNPMSGNELLAKYNQPSRIMKLDVETEKWVFSNGDDTSTYFLVRNGDVMDSGLEVRKHNM